MTQPEYEQEKAECWEDIWSPYREEVFMSDYGRELLIVADKVFKAAFDRAYALGKQEKDAEEMSIDKEEYADLCKCRRYIANWVPYYSVCPICGEYNPSGCICANCNNDKNWNK